MTSSRPAWNVRWSEIMARFSVAQYRGPVYLGAWTRETHCFFQAVQMVTGFHCMPTFHPGALENSATVRVYDCYSPSRIQYFKYIVTRMEPVAG